MKEKQEKILCISHTDLDGYFSGALVDILYKTHINSNCTIKHKSWTYGQETIDTEQIIKKFDKVFLVDLCVSTEFVITMYNAFGENFIWIDHHKLPDEETEQEFIKTVDEDITKLKGFRAFHGAACELVWNFFYGKETNKTFNPFTGEKEQRGFTKCPKYAADTHHNAIPAWLRLLSDFDNWNRENEEFWKEEIMPYQMCMRSKVNSVKNAITYLENLIGSYDGFTESFAASVNSIEHSIGHTNPEEDLNEDFYNIYACNKVHADIVEGEIMYKTYKSIYNREAKHGFARKVNYKDSTKEGTLAVYLVNTQSRSSVLFEDMKDLDKYDVFVPYHFSGEKYQYSMYTFKDDIDCSQTVLQFGYNELPFKGHRKAAGATSETFFFETAEKL